MLAGVVASAKHVPGHRQGKDDLLEIGTITTQTPTVSELLYQHADLKKRTWEILRNPHNQKKNYRAIQAGTTIYLNPQSGELSWSQGTEKHPAGQLNNVVNAVQTRSPAPARGERGLTAKETPMTSTEKPVRLGVITNDAPTVSHVLRKNSRFRDHVWNILDQAVNAEKPFHRVPPGATVMLNPATMEITWESKAAATSFAPVAQSLAAENKIAPAAKALPGREETVADLSQAVQSYIGKPYKEIDCYELLVNGLKQLDIPYSGTNGLYSRLTRLAVDRGMAANAYLNGEGIVEVAGSTILAKNYRNLTDWQTNAEKLTREMEPLLSNGQILSFSTQTRGHTGIVSRQDGRWTFINSGMLDNPVGEPTLNRGVGEEILSSEIRNWFRLAHNNGEPLRVTLGELRQEKIRTAANSSQLPGNRI